MLVTSTTGSSATGDGTVRMKEPLMQNQRLAPPAPATLCCGRVPVRGILVVVGGFLMHMTLGTQLTYGNTNPYLVSYIRRHSSPDDIHYVDGIWIQACMLMGQGVSMFAGGIIEHRLGPRIASLVGCWCLSAGVLLTYLTIKISFAMSVLTYGMMFGLGCGLAYPIPVTCAMKWFPEHRGLVGGIVFSGFGCGPIVFNQVITLYLNPSNLPPTQKGQDDVYFTQEEILQRVPNLFLVLGCTYAVMQLIGALLTIYPVTSQGSHEAVSSEGSPEMRGFVNSSESPENVLVNETGNDLDIPPLQMLKTKNFYLLWFLFLLGGMGGVFVVALYKSYGQSFIADDEFLAIVGSCSAVLNAVGGIFWGHVADRFTFNVAAKILYVLFASAVFTFSGAEHGGKPYFMIWVCVIFFAISGKYAIMPPAVARMYGNTYMSTNYGLLYTSQVLTSAASAFMGVTLQQMLHYTGQFFLIGGFACVGFIVTFFLDARTPDGKEV